VRPDPLLAVLIGLTVVGLVRAVEWLDPPAADRCRVTGVIDGDSLTLLCGSEAFEARLVGIDAPEMHGACPAETAAARRSRDGFRALVAAAAEVEVRRHGRDRYGRVLVDLMLDGVDVTEILLAQGHGRPYYGGRRAGWCG
jgi:micrococcal nuclease